MATQYLYEIYRDYTYSIGYHLHGEYAHEHISYGYFTERSIEGAKKKVYNQILNYLKSKKSSDVKESNKIDKLLEYPQDELFKYFKIVVSKRRLNSLNKIDFGEYHIY